MESPSRTLEGFTRNNHAPPNAIIEEVTAMLREPLQGIHDLDAEIQSLEERLTELKSRRSHSQQQITPYQSILSPIRRLPTDILGEIFCHCLPTHRNSVIKTAECPLLLTQICSRWRAVAIADPRLWSSLYITFSDDDLIPVGEVDGIDSESFTTTLLASSKRRAEHLLRNRIDAVKEWLSRSGSRPLSISLKFTCNAGGPNIHSDHTATDDMSLELFEYLASLSPRFGDLELDMTIDIYRFLENMMDILEMKMLKSFKGTYHGSHLFGRRPDSLDAYVRLLSAPNLRKISMAGESPLLWGISAHNWSNITHLSCYQSLSISRMAFFLESCPNVVCFRGTIGKDPSPGSNGASGPTHSFQSEIFLPFLHTLHLTDDVDPSVTSKLYNIINAPALHCLALSARFPFHESTQGPPRISIIPLLNKSAALKKLTLDAQDISRWGVHWLFRAVPSITHLVVGVDSRSIPKALTSRPEAIALMSYRTIKSAWDIGGLLADHTSTVETDPPLLPNLESLEVSIRNAYFPDEKIKDFIISRLDPSSSQRTKPLKRVRVNFFREKEQEVEQEIRRHAERVGLDLDLELSYPDASQTTQPRTFSPEYGLNIHDGRSWAPIGFESLDF